MLKYKIIKLRADKIIDYGRVAVLKSKEYDVFYQIDLDKEVIYGSVVEEQLLMENCALFDQFNIVLEKSDEKEYIREWLLQEFVIVDFTHIYKENNIISEEHVEKLISSGFLMNYQGREVHMLPFDKSGNMSRKCRLSYINAEYIEIMNERLNLGIDFSEIPLKLSKFYAYRGLYLSTAKRIQHEMLKITPESLIVISDIQNMKYYKKDIYVREGVPDSDNDSQISFINKEVKKEEIAVPFDGQGIISPFYADLVGEVLGNEIINSFQIRLPFSKGMLHRVDFHGFFREFDEGYNRDSYEIVDAFGIKRDLKLANIIMNKSMFKCYDWLKKYCKNTDDPMAFYCNALEHYNHALYISSTDLPYGNSKVTHISYQLLNTLKLTEEQFNSLIDKQLDYIHNPIRYIEMSQGQRMYEEPEDGAYCDFANWQKALLLNPSFGNLSYIKNQLRNTQAALMTKLALGKLVVKGQTRYMTRDLPFMLVSLIQDGGIRKKLENLKVFNYRFFLPQGTSGSNDMGLEYHTFCGFFRSPHLSRNEQGALVPVIDTEKAGEQYKKDLDAFRRYFGHLTGIVMFGNESLEPMALGGADFDGDLASMIMDEDVVSAIIAGAYVDNKNGRMDLERRRDTPYIKIPEIRSNDEVVPKLIPYLQIKNTFSNKVGLISNAAISIGQYEYGNKEGYAGTVKCSDCTILTGLEIDAAKNGVHPDLSKITDNEEIQSCVYLKFKKDFDRLRKRKDYHFNQLYFKKKGDEYSLGIKNTDCLIKYVEEKGTYINKLPIIFMENLDPELNIPTKNDVILFSFPKVKADKQKEKNFKEYCKAILDTYKYYVKLFGFINKNLKQETFAERNLKKLLAKQYDADQIQIILTEDLPFIYKIIVERIRTYSDYMDLKNKINQMKWHLMDFNEKKRFLCSVMQLEVLDEKKWSIVLSPYNHNYKVLWYIVQMIGEEIRPGYNHLKQEYDKRLGEEQVLYPRIFKDAEILMRNYVENKEESVSANLYSISLNALRSLVECSDLPLSKKIEILFKLTKNKIQEARFFWECFEWDELKTYVVKEEESYAE